MGNNNYWNHVSPCPGFLSFNGFSHSEKNLIKDFPSSKMSLTNFCREKWLEWDKKSFQFCTYLFSKSPRKILWIVLSIPPQKEQKTNNSWSQTWAAGIAHFTHFLLQKKFILSGAVQKLLSWLSLSNCQAALRQLWGSFLLLIVRLRSLPQLPWITSLCFCISEWQTSSEFCLYIWVCAALVVRESFSPKRTSCSTAPGFPREWIRQVPPVHHFAFHLTRQKVSPSFSFLETPFGRIVSFHWRERRHHLVTSLCPLAFCCTIRQFLTDYLGTQYIRNLAKSCLDSGGVSTWGILVQFFYQVNPVSFEYGAVVYEAIDFCQRQINPDTYKGQIMMSPGAGGHFETDRFSSSAKDCDGRSFWVWSCKLHERRNSADLDTVERMLLQVMFGSFWSWETRKAAPAVKTVAESYFYTSFVMDGYVNCLWSPSRQTHQTSWLPSSCGLLSSKQR